jgi:hypothetical protein
MPGWRKIFEAEDSPWAYLASVAYRAKVEERYQPKSLVERLEVDCHGGMPPPGYIRIVDRTIVRGESGFIGQYARNDFCDRSGKTVELRI